MLICPSDWRQMSVEMLNLDSRWIFVLKRTQAYNENKFWITDHLWKEHTSNRPVSCTKIH